MMQNELESAETLLNLLNQAEDQLQGGEDPWATFAEMRTILLNQIRKENIDD